MQIWVGALGAVGAVLVALTAGPVVAHWASGTSVRLPTLLTTATAAVGGFVAGARLGLEPALVAFEVLAVVASILVGIDLRLHRLPDRLTLPLSGAGLALLAAAAIADGHRSAFLRAILGGLALLVSYLALFLVARSGLGAGDVKLAGGLGLYLAWLGWPTLVLGATAGFLAGGLISLALLATRRATMATRVPFGPSMIAGALLAIAAGNAQATTLLGW